jgi:hypothetical protein
MQACHKEGFDYEYADTKVDSISFSAGSPSLIADGQSALKFIIQAYSKKQVTISGVTQDSMVLIPSDRIPDSDKKVFDETGKEVGLAFSTTLSHTCHQILLCENWKYTVCRKAEYDQNAWRAYSKIIIPVVIHVFRIKEK